MPIDTVAQNYWEQQAASFDDEPDHGLHDPAVRRAWTERIVTWLPATCANVLDIGCGTGSLSVVLAELGHNVTGIDFSPAMIAQATNKAQAAHHSINFLVMDAANPRLAAHQFDVIVCRHLLWALPEPAQVLARWCQLLTAAGQLVLIEGFWHTGGGLHAQEIVTMLPAGFSSVHIQDLSHDQKLWGSPVTDERYAIIAALADENEI